MQIEYSGRYKKLLMWAELKERLFDAISNENDSILLEAVRTEIVEATTLVYQRLQQLRKEADEVNAYYDEKRWRLRRQRQRCIEREKEGITALGRTSRTPTEEVNWLYFSWDNMTFLGKSANADYVNWACKTFLGRGKVEVEEVRVHDGI